MDVNLGGTDSLGVGAASKEVRKVFDRIMDVIDIPLEIAKAKSEEKATDIQVRATRRRELEDIRHQQNIESILRKSAPRIDEGDSINPTPEEVSSDWLDDFFDKCRHISDKNAQEVWAAVLAGKMKHPQGFSKKLLNVLFLMEEQDAIYFRDLCRITANIDGRMRPLIYEVPTNFSGNIRFDYDLLSRLEGLGLISITDGKTVQFCKQNIVKVTLLNGYCFKFTFSVTPDSVYKFPVGKVLLTDVGLDLLRLQEKLEPMPGFEKYLESIFDKIALKDQQDKPEETAEDAE